MDKEELKQQTLAISKPITSSDDEGEEDGDSEGFQLEDLEVHNQVMIRGEMQKRLQAKIDRLEKEEMGLGKRLEETR
jgi:SNF2 family DNA or RNA helicase